MYLLYAVYTDRLDADVRAVRTSRLTRKMYMVVYPVRGTHAKHAVFSEKFLAEPRPWSANCRETRIRAPPLLYIPCICIGTDVHVRLDQTARRTPCTRTNSVYLPYAMYTDRLVADVHAVRVTSSTTKTDGQCTFL